MNKQYYVREGRRFVKTDVPRVVDHRGEYYNEDGSFSKERTSVSIGLCIMQTPTECIICRLSKNEKVSYPTAKNYLRGRVWRLGTQEELLTAFKKYRSQLNLSFYTDYWVSLSGGGADGGAYRGWFYFIAPNGSSCARAHFGGSCYLRLFKTVSITM